MLQPTRSMLLVLSSMIVVLLLGGGFALRVGATENSYRQAVRFAEILSMVMENYVDPVEAEGLLRGAYEGMLGGLDPNGAFLTPEEVKEWKKQPISAFADPGAIVLKLGHSLQVISVDPGSPADEAGMRAGDHIRSVDGQLVRDLSLAQARRLLQGPLGSTVTLELLHPQDSYRREELELTRQNRRGVPHDLEVVRGTAVLSVRDLDRIDPAELHEELDDVRSRGVERLLLDLRNLAEGDTRRLNRVAALFVDSEGTLLRLRDRSGRQVEAVEGGSAPARWPGSLAVLVNGATAGAAEALALLTQTSGDATVFGEETYGLGSEAKLFELENGYGLLVSSVLWETAEGESWNLDGVEPDRLIRAAGRDFDQVQARQLDEVLGLLEEDEDESDEEKAPAEAA